MTVAATIWTAVSILGLLISATSVWDSWQDYQALGSIGNGRRTVAKSMMRAQTLRFTTFALFAFLGVAVMADWSARRFAPLILVSAAVLILVDSSLDAAVRRRVLRQPERRKPQ